MDSLWGMVWSSLSALFILLVAIVIEHVGPIERFTLRARAPGFLMNVVGTSLSIGLVWPLSWLWQRIGLGPTLVVPLWSWLQPLGWAGLVLQVLLLVALADFLAYWRHRAEHAWFWRIHVVHHSPRELHAANDIGHPLQTLFTFGFVTIPLSLVQIDGPETPSFVTAIVILLSTYIHSPIDAHFGPFRKILVDNRFHRIHHSLDPRHFDKNFGICFSLWDYMFGTAYEPGKEWPAVGVEGVTPPRTVGEFLKLPLLVPDSTGPEAGSAIGNRAA